MSVMRKSFLVALLSGAALMGAEAAEPTKGLEDALQAALQSKRGITVYVNGQTIGGAVTRIEPGAWVELRNQEFGRIVVRLDRIDGIAAP
jgi:hypothetical protein